MSRLTIHPEAPTDAQSQPALAAFLRRLQATPPGQCPITLLHSYVAAAAAQTCGKCVPCRDGLPQLARLLEKIAEGADAVGIFFF